MTENGKLVGRESLREELKEAVSDLRKAAYEFGLLNNLDDHEIMMQAQLRIFQLFDKALEE